jgi:large subunit ribosomal protein L14
MIGIESCLKAADNAGAILLKCITVYNGFRRRYASLGEVIGTVSRTRRVYNSSINKKILAKKVQKKRKEKSKKKKPNVRPYLALLVAVKKSTNRRDGSYIKFDENRVLTFSEPTKFGPAGKSTMEPNFLGSRIFGPICREVRASKGLNEKYRSVIQRSRGVV